MNWLELLKEIFEVCVVPLLGILTGFAVKAIKEKTKAFEAEHSNEIVAKYMVLVEKIIIDAVVATNQTYVHSLKNAGTFDTAAQKKAFELTFSTVKNLLSNEAKDVLSIVYGDLVLFLNTKIEAVVKQQKNW